MRRDGTLEHPASMPLDVVLAAVEDYRMKHKEGRQDVVLTAVEEYRVKDEEDHSSSVELEESSLEGSEGAERVDCSLMDNSFRYRYCVFEKFRVLVLELACLIFFCNKYIYVSVFTD